MRRDLAAVYDMLKAAREVVGFCEGLDLEALSIDERTQYAVAFGVVVIGEAASRISTDFRDQYSEVPWAKAKTMRNVIVHDYDKVLLTVMWETVQHSIPPLIEQLEAILDEHA